MRLIDADLLEERLLNRIKDMQGQSDSQSFVSAMIDSCVLSELRRTPTASWHTATNGEWRAKDIGTYACSICGHVVNRCSHNSYALSRYCDRCGSKMRDDDDLTRFYETEHQIFLENMVKTVTDQTILKQIRISLLSSVENTFRKYLCELEDDNETN